ncbi:MAG: T9SS type A sorting domain-containing protein [Bacteroidetes bacterium]|nr:T9SS type A sorting domain-containing protein [Bacteroidota bacterium]
MNIRGLLIAGACIALSAASAFAQYSIQSSVIGSGGGPASNSTYSMNGTIGQPVIGLVSGSQYAVGQGFWHSMNLTSDVTPIAGPDGYDLEQNFPNPFNPSTTIRFSIAEPQKVTLKIMNLLGEEVARPINAESMGAGKYEYVFQAENIPSGTYIYRLEAGNFVKTRKMVLTK